MSQPAKQFLHGDGGRILDQGSAQPSSSNEEDAVQLGWETATTTSASTSSLEENKEGPRSNVQEPTSSAPDEPELAESTTPTRSSDSHRQQLSFGSTPYVYAPTDSSFAENRNSRPGDWQTSTTGKGKEHIDVSDGDEEDEGQVGSSKQQGKVPSRSNDISEWPHEADEMWHLDDQRESKARKDARRKEADKRDEMLNREARRRKRLTATPNELQGLLHRDNQMIRDGPAEVQGRTPIVITPILEYPTFSGEEGQNVILFLRRFDEIAEQNRWTELEGVYRLAYALQGQAASVQDWISSDHIVVVRRQDFPEDQFYVSVKEREKHLEEDYIEVHPGTSNGEVAVLMLRKRIKKEGEEEKKGVERVLLYVTEDLQDPQPRKRKKILGRSRPFLVPFL